MSRKSSAVLHLPRELVRELSADLIPVTEAGFHPLKVDVIAEVAGSLGPSGALIPIKELHNILQKAINGVDQLHSDLATLSTQLWHLLKAGIESREEGHSLDLELASLEIIFENGTKFKVSPEASALTLTRPLNFQHSVEFDLGKNGELLHHGHSSEVSVEMAVDGVEATRLIAQSLTGEMIVQGIAEAVNKIGLRQDLVKVSLQETSKNRFTALFDKPQS